MTNLRARVEGVLEAQFGTHIRESSDTTEGVLDCLKDNATNELISLLSEVLEECQVSIFDMPSHLMVAEEGARWVIDQTRTNLKERMKL